MTTDTFLEMLGHLSLIGIVGGVCWYMGWKSASAYLSAAQVVAAASSASVSRSNSYATTLDGLRNEMQSLVHATEARHKASAEHDRAVEESLLALFQGLERAGLARAPRATPRQHGEAPTDS